MLLLRDPENSVTSVVGSGEGAFGMSKKLREDESGIRRYAEANEGRLGMPGMR